MRIVLIILFCALSVSPAWAQAPAVTARQEPAGDLSSAAREQLRHLQDTGAVRVERRSDPLLNGALIGAAVAIGAGLSFCTLTEPWENCRDDVGPMLRIGALGAAIGIGIDALIEERNPGYRPATAQMRVAPLLGRGAGGLGVMVRF